MFPFNVINSSKKLRSCQKKKKYAMLQSSGRFSLYTAHTHTHSLFLSLSFSARDACNAYKVRSIYFHFWQSKNFSFYQTPNCKWRSGWVSVWVYVKMCECLCVCVCWLRAAAYPLTTPPLRSNAAFVAVDWPNHLHTECTFCLRFTRRCLPPLTVPAAPTVHSEYRQK